MHLKMQNDQGTHAHDSITLEHSNLQRSTNRAGGIEGGISNGGPIVICVAMKPIATTLTPQQTVDLASGVEAPTKYERSDFCPVPARSDSGGDGCFCFSRCVDRKTRRRFAERNDAALCRTTQSHT